MCLRHCAWQGWNILDLVVVLWMLSDSTTLNVYALRFFRILRPLLENTLFEDFQTALNALLRLRTVVFLIFAALVSIIFAMSVSTVWAFRGRIHYCNDPTVRDQLNCFRVFLHSDGFPQPRVWDAPTDSFDSVQDALLACFRSLNRSGWRFVVEEVMFAADDNEMRPEHRVEAHALPFIVVEILCNLLLFQAMMAIMINAINVTSGYALLTSPQIVFESTVSTIQNARREFVRYVQAEGIECLQMLVQHPYFEGVTTMVIFINIVVLIFDSFSLGEAEQAGLGVANQLFVYFYVWEQGLKMAAFSWAYFVPKINGSRRVSYTNVFDFIVTLGSFLEITVLRGQVCDMLCSLRGKRESARVRRHSASPGRERWSILTLG